MTDQTNRAADSCGHPAERPGAAPAEWRAMGCQVLVAIDAPEPATRRAVAEARAWFAGWERTLSRFRDDSELTALNRAAGSGWRPVGATLWEVVAAAVEAARASEGLVTPTLLDALEAAGYDRDFAALGRSGRATAAAPAATPAAHDWRAIALDARRRVVSLPRGARLDLGGIAKGWAADTAAARLAAVGPALVDVGGDIAVSGPRADGSPWPIGVADPLGGDEPLEILLLAAGGVATSGRDYRRWRDGGAERHHIIDPRTGQPAATDVLSATVVAPTAREAEAAAKAALIRGAAHGLRWLAARPHLAALLVTEDGDTLRTPTLEACCWAPAAPGR